MCGYCVWCACKVWEFCLSSRLYYLDSEVEFKIPIILGRTFFSIGRAIVGIENGKLKFRQNSEEVKFNVCQLIKQPRDIIIVPLIDVDYEECADVWLVIKFDDEFIKDNMETAITLNGMRGYPYSVKR